MSSIVLKNLFKLYGDHTAVAGIDLHIKPGEFFSLLGPSGCGKSTILRMIAGFIRPTSGQIMIGSDDVTQLPPEKRDIGIVFQSYAIFPHMSVAENIAFGLKLRKKSRPYIHEAVVRALDQVGLTGYENYYQHQLSGGQQQRVALARVLVTEPRILLLDEPLSALDKALREEMKSWIKSLQRKLGITTLYVTHDQDEALTLSDRVGVMQKARVEQVGTPQEIYERPKTLFVTTFIGQSNVIDATVKGRDANQWRVGFGDYTTLVRATTTPLVPGAGVKLVVRPENVSIGESGTGFPATIISETYQGALVRYQLSIGNQTVIAERQNQPQVARFSPGQAVGVAWDPECAEILVA